MHFHTKKHYHSSSNKLFGCWCLLLLVIFISSAKAASKNASAISDDVEATKIIALISHQSHSELSINDLKLYYSLRKKLMKNGDRALLTTLDLDTQESIEVFRFLMGVYPYQIQRTWDRAVFSGRGSAPIILNESQQIITYVSQNTGALGYVSVSSQAELESIKEKVNVVAIVQ